MCGDLRFERIRGIGVDAKGDVYVCHVGDAGMCQTRLECHAADGRLRWRLDGTSFLDQVDDDPTPLGDVFSAFNRYRVDLRAPASSDWTWVASTVDRARYPDDPRLNGSALTYGFRQLHGHRFLITTTQHGHRLNVLRFVDDDQAAIPSVVLSFRTTGLPWPPHQPLGFGPFIWRDVDGDGLPEFVDGWGRPISFIRWPAGFRSVLQSLSENDPADPIDPLGVTDTTKNYTP